MKAKKRHSGLDLLRLALGAAMPDKARKGALMPKYLAPLAGVNYETVRQLLNGARDFESDTPLNEMMASNLALTTGVDPNFRKTREAFIRDIIGHKYTGETYLQWEKSGPLSEIVQSASRGLPGEEKGTKKEEPLSARMREQSGKLVSAIFAEATSLGPQFECMAFRLLKSALAGVAKDLGVLKQVTASPELRDFSVGIDANFWQHLGAIVSVIEERPWSPDSAALSISAHHDGKDLLEGLSQEMPRGDAVAILKKLRPLIRSLTGQKGSPITSHITSIKTDKSASVGRGAKAV